MLTNPPVPYDLCALLGAFSVITNLRSDGTFSSTSKNRPDHCYYLYSASLSLFITWPGPRVTRSFKGVGRNFAVVFTLFREDVLKTQTFKEIHLKLGHLSSKTSYRQAA